MNSETRSSGSLGRLLLPGSMAARLVAALILVGSAYALLVIAVVGSAAASSARSSLLIAISLIFALLTGLLLSLWTALKSTYHLLERFEQASRDPDAALKLPLMQDAPTSEGRRLLESCSGLLAQIQASQHKLRTIEERFELALAAANEGLWDWHLPTDTVYFSPRWKQMLGYADHELTHSFAEWEQRVHPADRERAMGAIEEHLAGRTPYYELEHRLLHRDGSYRWVLSRGIAVRDGHGQPYRMAGSHTDITEQKQTQDDLRDSESRFRTLFEQSPFAIQLFTPGGNVLHANQAFLNLWGLTAVEQLGDFNILQDEQLAAVGLLPYIQRGFAGEATTVPVMRYDPAQTPSILDGRPRWVQSVVYPIKDAAGTIREVAVIFDDITERTLAEEALRASEARFRTIFEGAAIGIVLIDKAGRAVETNPALQQMLGCNADELRHRLGDDFTHPDDLQADLRLYRELLAHKRDAYQIEKRYLRKDRTIFWGRLTISLIRGGLDDEHYAVAMIENIDEQKRVYELLEQRVAERTRELSMLLDVSHNVASTLELKPLLGLILDQLRTVLAYDGATIYIVEHDQLVVQDYRRPIADNAPVPFRYPLQQISMLWDALCAGAPVMIPDTHGDTPLARFYQTIMGQQLYAELSYIRSWMGVPLLLKDQVIGVLTVSHSEAHHFTPQHARLALAIANQAAIAIENAKLFEQAQALATLMERQRLARELHDSVSQALYGIALGARTARTLLDRDPSRLAEPLDYVLSLADAGLTEMRALIFELRPESLELEGLVVALTKQAASIRARHNIDVQTNLCAEPELPIERKEALYRISQEALHNIVKHAQATRVELRLMQDNAQLVLTVQDNGQGFDPAQPFPGHLGLRSMRERVARLGGSFDVESTPGQGTLIRARMPA